MPPACVTTVTEEWSMCMQTRVLYTINEVMHAMVEKTECRGHRMLHAGHGMPRVTLACFDVPTLSPFILVDGPHVFY